MNAVAKAVSQYEEYTKWQDFKAFYINQARGLKNVYLDVAIQRLLSCLAKQPSAAH
jgi:hypothetical protein